MREIGEADWELAVMNNPVPVLVDIYAPWCGPCKMMKPVVEKVANALEPEGKAVVFLINGDKNENLLTKLGVSAYPTLIIFKSGLEYRRFTGIQKQKTLIDALTD